MKRNLLLIFIIDVLVMAFIFGRFGFYDAGVDTDVYVDEINFFAGRRADATHSIGLAAAAGMRVFKPLYGIIGADFYGIVSQYNVILILNILFFVGLSYVFYFILREFNFDDGESFIGSVWLITGYPMFKYGLSLGVDVSGWFFACASILFFMVGVRKNKFKYFLVASALGFLGFSSKETGVLGLLFAGIYTVLHIGRWQLKRVLTTLFWISVPFLFFESIQLAVMTYAKILGFLDWYSSSIANYAGEYYKFFYFVGVELSTFNVLWLFCIFSIPFFIQSIKRTNFTEEFIVVLSIFLSTLPVLAWPIFISRILYVQFLFVIPLALYGFCFFKKKYLNFFEAHKGSDFYFAAVPVLINLILILISGKSSLFLIIKKLL